MSDLPVVKQEGRNDPLVDIEHLQKYVSTADVVSRVIFFSTQSISIQASRYHYSSPNSDTGPWYKFELGHPSKDFDILKPYAEDSDDYTRSVYPYVPVDVVLELIKENGGINWLFTILK